MNYEFNILQKNIFISIKNDKNILHYNQILEHDVKWGNSKECYIKLLKNFNILRTTINIVAENYTVHEHNENYYNIKKCKYADFKFSYNDDLYLTALVEDDEKTYFIFHHLFIDGKSLQLIANFFMNLDIDVSKNYYLCDINNNIKTHENKNVINANLLKKDLNQKSFYANNTIILNIDKSHFDNFAKQLTISSHSLHFGILNLAMRIFSDVKNDYTIHDCFHGRDDVSKNVLGFFSYLTEIDYENIDDLNIYEYLKFTHNSIKTTGKITTNRCNVVINDVRNVSIFMKSNITHGNNDLLCDLAIKILQNNVFLIQGKSKKITNMHDILQNVYDNVLYEKQQLKIKDIDFHNKPLTNIKDINFHNNLLTNTKDTFNNPVKICYLNIIKNQNKIAIIADDKKITFLQLYLNAKQIANTYFTHMPKNTIIPICSEKNIELISFLMAIFISGLAFCLIDVNLAENEIQKILVDLKADIFMSKKNIKFDGQIVYPIFDINVSGVLNEDITHIPHIEQSDIAYVLFTSGSTGTPKGIVEHYGTINNVTQVETSLYNYDVKGSILNYAFDVSIFDIFSCLIYCKTLVLFKNMNDLTNLKYVDILLMTPTIFNHLEMQILQSNIKIILLAGEKINITRDQYNIFKHITFYNLYGPTEIGIYCSAKKILNYEDMCNQNIGIPINNMNMVITDKNLNECPKNVIGEICVSGIQLFCGYLDKNLDTNIVNTKKYNDIYKTGDYGLLNDSGEIEYVGRIDNQIKRNGIRIELSHIDNVLIKNPNVKHVISIFKNDKITTSIQLTNLSTYTENDIYKYLFQHLNQHYLPNVIEIVKKFNFNTNGKFVADIREKTIKLVDIKTLRLKTMIGNTFGITIDDPDKHLYFYGFDSLKIIQLENMLIRNTCLKINNSVTQLSTLNEISDIYNDSLKYVIYENNDCKNLLIIFRDGYRNYNEHIKKLNNYDFLIVENYKHIKSKNPFDEKFNVIYNYVKKNYKKIFILSRCVGCIQTIPYLDIAQKIVYDTPIFDRFLCDDVTKNEKINMLIKNDEKIYYYFANSTEYREISMLTNLISLKNLKK